MNISQHIASHKEISQNKLMHYIEKSNVVPLCYTKRIGNKICMLEKDEMEMAKKKNATIIKDEYEILNDLKQARTKMEGVAKELTKFNRNESSENYKKLKEKLDAATEEYKAKRYQDVRKYTGKKL